jgi:peptide/nickel transport system permease protein
MTRLRSLWPRLATAGLTLAATLLLCFGLAQFTPGDAFTSLELDPTIPAAALAHWRALYLPQQNWVVRFAHWVGAAGRGQLGYSLEYHRSVASLLRQRVPASFELMILGLGLAWGSGLLLALIPAWLGESGRERFERRLGWVLHGLAAVLTALPLGVLAIGALLFAPLAWLPTDAQPSPWLPASVLALAFLPTVYFQAAQALAQVRGRPFLLQGRAAGFSPMRLLLRHALPNTSDVLVPVASLTITQALVELVILEPLLGWPGIGQLSIQAAQSKDLPVLSALVLLSGLLAITANMLSDVVQARLHPQLRARAA